MIDDRAERALDPEQVPIVFVCGLHRSGTSLLARLLGSSPGVRTMRDTGVPEDEGQHLQHSFPPALAHGGPGAFALDPEAHLTEMSPLASTSTARAVLDAWTPHWHLGRDVHLDWGAEPGTGVLLEKSPPNLIRTRFLQALFPRARFVVLLRHPAVVAAATQRLNPRLDIRTALEHWVAAHAQYTNDAARLQVVTQLRYEDLVTDPLGELRRLALVLEIDPRFDVSVLESWRSDVHFATWQRVVADLATARVTEIDEQVQTYGYSLSEPFVHPVPRPH